MPEAGLAPLSASDGAAASFDCRRHDVIEAGDHVILIGEVVGFDQARRNPLG